MSRLLAIVSCVLVSSVIACSQPSSDGPSDALEARIARIENGLMPVVHIAGTDPITFNLEDRLEEFGVAGLSVAFVATERSPGPGRGA